MTTQNLASQYIPQYVPRSAEQRQIIDEAAEVKNSGKSRAVLLYGRGGIGKTRLVRQLPAIDKDSKVVWLEPVDVDDSQQWLLSNLERYIVDQLDRDGQYFGPYHEYVSELPKHRLMPASRQLALDHLNRVKEVFTECYRNYIEETGNTVVITFDTVEVIRGMYLLRTLTQWMKALPGTLFVLAGRPQRDGTGRDPVMAALEDHPDPMAVTVVQLGEFVADDCREYLTLLGKDTDLADGEMEKFVYLTQGHPLWLAFTVDYLAEFGVPEEAGASLEEIKADLPYHGVASEAGRERADSFKRRLMTPYRDTDFWHEAIKRLAVVRESVSEPIWLKLMSDRRLPGDEPDGDRAWETLTAKEWIRLRANRRYVTLHDAVAEELTQRIINLHHIDQSWRQQLWRRAAGIYAEEAAVLEGQLSELQSDVDSRLALVNAPGSRSASEGIVPDEASLMRDVAEMNRWQQELNQLKAAQLIYELLSDFLAGAQRFVALMRQASRDHDVLFEDLLAFQMQRFLPGEHGETALRDAIGGAIEAFRHWIRRQGQASYIDIGLEMSSYFIDRDEYEEALDLLRQLPSPADHKLCYRLRGLQGNACMRIPASVRDARDHFEAALRHASQVPLPDRHTYIADAYKELGFYYRNIGRWQDADTAYGKARDAIAQALRLGSPGVDREEMASINTNWAYVKAIGGKHDDAINLVESAITVRSRLGRRHEQAISCSVRGEVYRYDRQFKEAWDAYEEAVELFGETSRSWLGVVRQEQAICLFQSIPAGVQLIAPPADPLKRAELLILESLDLCRVFNVRNYPSALNRAGRIIGATNVDAGLGYLEEAADKAEAISDGWFWLASLIEHAELCYRAWSGGKNPDYRERIEATGVKLQHSEEAGVEFLQLRGRWQVLQGHLALHQVFAGDAEMLDVALDNYMTGFPLILHGWVGSYGASVIPTEFRKFRDLVWRLPDDTRAHWQQELYREWSSEEAAATQLLARLEELY